MKRTILKVFKFLVVFCVVVIVLDVAFVVLVAKMHREPEKADAVIILGAAINSPALYNRTLEGLSLYKQGKADVLVLSGGRISNRDVSEAGYMKRVLEKNVSPLPDIRVDDESSNTEENIRNARKLIPEAKSVIIVSDEFHLGRGMLLAIRNGFYPVYVSAPKPEYYKSKELIWYYFREVVAIIAYIPTFIFNK